MPVITAEVARQTGHSTSGGVSADKLPLITLFNGTRFSDAVQQAVDADTATKSNFSCLCSKVCNSIKEYSHWLAELKQ